MNRKNRMAFFLFLWVLTTLPLAGSVQAQGEGTPLETAVQESLDRTHLFIDLYGAAQRLQGKRYVADPEGNHVAKLSNGQLTFATITQWVDPTEHAQGTASFARQIQAQGILFLVAIGPTKLSLPGVQMPEGLSDYGNAIADAYLAALEGQTDTFDLRPAFCQGPNPDRYFFSTDHHWTPEGALYGCDVLMEELHRRYGFPVWKEALSQENYRVEVREAAFLGSQGKRVGRCYGGVDDFSVFSPQFDTAFRYTIAVRALTRTGTFDQALCFPAYLEEEDLFQANPYNYYSGGDWGRATITNPHNPEGPRVLLIRESFSGALAPFLALQCGELTTIDPRHYRGDLVEEVAALQPDLVLLFCAASSVRGEELFSLFP